MPWSRPILARIDNDLAELCRCQKAGGLAFKGGNDHRATHSMTTIHTDAKGKRDGSKVVNLCEASAAAAAHFLGLVHPVFNPSGEKMALYEPAT